MGLVSRWFCLKCWHQVRMDVYIIKTPLIDGLREHSEGKYLRGKIFKWYIWFFTLSGNKWSEVHSHTDLSVVTNALAGWSGIWKD